MMMNANTVLVEEEECEGLPESSIIGQNPISSRCDI
jgi:hypothetical protein